MLQDGAADPAAGPTRADENGPDARGVGGRIEKGVLSARRRAAAGHLLPPAPAAAAGDLTIDDGDEVRSVVDELLVRTADECQRAGYLMFGVSSRSELLHRLPHHGGDRRHIRV